MEVNKRAGLVVAELFLKGTKLKIPLVFISECLKI